MIDRLAHHGQPIVFELKLGGEFGILLLQLANMLVFRWILLLGILQVRVVRGCRHE
ncbi:hypothetical protein D3C73_1590260 [compost metagenome]